MRDRSVQRKKEGNIKYPLVISPSRQPEQEPCQDSLLPLSSPPHLSSNELEHMVLPKSCVLHFFVPQSLIGISLLYIVSRGIMKIVFGLSSIGFNYLKLNHLIRRLVFMRKVKFNRLIASNFHIFALKQRN